MSLNSPSNHSEQPAPKSKLKRKVLFAAGVGALAGALLAAAKGDTNSTENHNEATVDCFAKATEYPENFKVKNCTPEEVNAELVGPTTIQIKDKVIKVMWVFEGKGDLTFTQPNILNVSSGVEFNVTQNGQEPGIIVDQTDNMLPYEGTIPEGTVIYRDLQTGKVSTDPKDLK